MHYLSIYLSIYCARQIIRRNMSYRTDTEFSVLLFCADDVHTFVTPNCRQLATLHGLVCRHMQCSKLYIHLVMNGLRAPSQNSTQIIKCNPTIVFSTVCRGDSALSVSCSRIKLFVHFSGFYYLFMYSLSFVINNNNSHTVCGL